MTAHADGELLFSYGTLQLARVQLESFGRLLTGVADVLDGYLLRDLEITDPAVLAASAERFHPIAVPGGVRDAVGGTRFAVTAAELAAADGYEVADYQRVRVTLRSGLDAWVYVAGQ